MVRSWGTDKQIAVALFILVSSVYFATVVGVTSSNDGSHYALVRAIVDRHTFEISPYLDFTEHQDYALRGDLRFSDRPPGTALAAAPLYALSTFLPTPLKQPPSKHDAENLRMIYAVALSPLAAASAVAIFYLTLRSYFNRSRFSALLVSLALAFGTTTWKYGSVLYSHALASFVLWASVFFVLRSWNQPLRWYESLLFGFLIGFAPLVEYTSILASMILGAAWLIGTQPIRNWWADQRQRANIIAFIVGAAIPLGFLLIYNTINFGGPFEFSTFNVDTSIWPQNQGMAADFATPLLTGLQGMLLYGLDNQGLFMLSPLALLGILGLWHFIRFTPRQAVFILGLFVVMLVIFSKSTTFNPLTNDGRYLTPFIGLWFVPIAFWVDEVYSEQRGEVWSLILGIMLFGLLFLSTRNQMVHIAFSWNYDFDMTRLRSMATAPENISYFLSTLFPNAVNLLLLWLGEGGLIGISTILMEWNTRRSQIRQPGIVAEVS